MERDYLVLVTAKNHTGVIGRISGLFSRRFFNIMSLVAAQSENPDISHLIIVVRGDANAARQAEKQLAKLYDVINVDVVDTENAVVREYLMLKVKNDKENTEKLISIASVFHANVLNVDDNCFIVEITGTPRTISSFVELYKGYGILQMLRTGAMAMTAE